MNKIRKQQGMAMVTMLIMITALSAIYVAYHQVTRFHVDSVKSSRSVAYGFYSAEAALNARVEVVRAIFQGFTVPTGTSPSTSTPCESGDNGSGDFACITYNFDGRTVYTYVEDVTTYPVQISAIADGDPFAGLSAYEYRFDVKAESKNTLGKTEAILGMRIISRTVPMFQFAAFYQDDLEITPNPPLTLYGPVHVNSNLFLGAFGSGQKNTEGPVSVVGNIYEGHKDRSGGATGTHYIDDPDGVQDADGYSWRQVTFSGGPDGGKMIMDSTDMAPYDGNVETGVDPVVVPDYGEVAYGSGPFWDNADLRVVVKLDSGGSIDNSCAIANGFTPFNGIEVQDSSGNCDASKTEELIDNCVFGGDTLLDNAVAYTSQLWNHPEQMCMQVLEINMVEFLNCAHSQGHISGGIGKTAGNGIALFFGFDGPNSAAGSNYSVRLRNAQTLQSTVSGAPSVVGLTAATNLPLYVWGNYNGVYQSDPENSTTTIPASLVGDRMWTLSNEWDDSVDGDCTTSVGQAKSGRPVSNNVATYAGLYFSAPITCGSNGPQNCTPNEWNGGIQNYAVIQESYGSGINHLLYGSFLNLNQSVHSLDPNANHSPGTYVAPTRIFGLDERLLDNPPPIAPKFVHIKQELFVRYFE